MQEPAAAVAMAEESAQQPPGRSSRLSLWVETPEQRDGAFGCTVSFANGDTFSITNGQDAATSNAAGNSFTFANDVTATYTGAGALSAAAENFAIRIVQDFTTAAGLLPAAFAGSVNLTGDCTPGLGANSKLNAGFTTNNGTNLGSTGAPCNKGNIAAATVNFNNVNIAAPNVGPKDTLRIVETLTFNFENNTPQDSFIRDPGSVTVNVVPEPGGISLMSIGLVGLAWMLHRKLAESAATE